MTIISQFLQKTLHGHYCKFTNKFLEIAKIIYVNVDKICKETGMSSMCNRCEQNDYLYEFFYNQAGFQEAVNNCTNKKGSLASDLDEETLMNFNECCSNAPGHQYYIGLVARSNGQCNLNSSGQFQWAESNTCTDGNPLDTLHAQPNSTCQAVVITTHDDKNMLPTSTVVNCTTKQHYICQIKKNLDVFPTISPATSTIKKTTDITLSEKTLSLLSTKASYTSKITPTFKIPKITSSSKTASSLYPSETSAASTTNSSTAMTFSKTASSFSTFVSSSAALNSALIAGIVIGIIAIILVLALALLCVFKKKYLTNVRKNRNKQPINLISKNKTKITLKQEQINPLYEG